MKDIIKKITYHFLFFLLLVSITESVLGSWFKSDGFGSIIRNGRLKNQLYEVEYNGKKYEFRYKKNYYGFRGEEVDPKNIKNFFLGASQGNEKWKPQELTIAGRLNHYLKQDGLVEKKIYNASQEGFSSFGILNYLLKFYPKIKNFNPNKMILYMGMTDGLLCKDYIENQKNISQFNSNLVWDNLIEVNKIKRLKDYLNNNSFFLNKLKIIQLKYFPHRKQKVARDEEGFLKKQINLKYLNYYDAQKIYTLNEIEKKYLPCKNRLLTNLDNILKFSQENKIQILFVSNINYKGVKDDWLYYTNLLIYDFAKRNSLAYIDIGKIKSMDKEDFYDDQHTTPRGSEKIAKFIYPEVVKFLNR